MSFSSPICKLISCSYCICLLKNIDARACKNSCYHYLRFKVDVKIFNAILKLLIFITTYASYEVLDSSNDNVGNIGSSGFDDEFDHVELVKKRTTLQ